MLINLILRINHYIREIIYMQLIINKKNKKLDFFYVFNFNNFNFKITLRNRRGPREWRALICQTPPLVGKKI